MLKPKDWIETNSSCAGSSILLSLLPAFDLVVAYLIGLEKMLQRELEASTSDLDHLGAKLASSGRVRS